MEGDCLIECVSKCVQNTCCGEQLVKNKSVASQLKNIENQVVVPIDTNSNK